MKKRVILSVILLSCVLGGCGIHITPKTEEKPIEENLEIETQEERESINDLKNIQSTQIESTETQIEETNIYGSSDIVNLNEMINNISKNVNGSIGYLLEYAQTEGYQNFALLVSNKSLYDEELEILLNKAQVPFDVNFCLLAQNVDNEYTYFRYKYNDLTKNMEIESEPLVDTSKDKKIINIGYIKDNNLLYTEIKSQEDTYEIFSNANGNIAIKNKLSVTSYIKDFKDGITTDYTSFSNIYKKYMESMIKIEFSKNVEELRQY